MCKINIFLLLGFVTGLLSCSPQQEVASNETYTVEANTLSEETASTENEKIVIYQMMTRLFGNKDTSNIRYGTLAENGVGKMNDISNKALTEIQQLGVSHVWYTGIIAHALLTDYTAYGIPTDDADVVKGRAGSPYAITDYYAVHPDLAEEVDSRMEEFEFLVQRTHNAGMKVIIDFVPNHVARSYQSLQKPDSIQDLGETDDTSIAFHQHNNFYYIPDTPLEVPDNYKPLGDKKHPTKDGSFDENPAKVTGNNVFSASPSKDDWFETIKLNYGIDFENDEAQHFDPVPDTWHKMKDILMFWSSKNIDGFRCDMAEMVPVEFWEWAIPLVKNEYPDVIFIAEIYNPEAYRDYLQQGKFDFLYDKVQLYDTLKQTMQGKASTAGITKVWKDLQGINHKMLRFLENHDEQRIASPEFAGNYWTGIPAMAVSTLLYTGPAMLYFGQEVGEPGFGESGFSGDDGRTTIFDYWGVPEHQKWMNKGAFDGGKLDENQQTLRRFYTALHQLALSASVVAKGDLIDIHAYNIEEKAAHYSESNYTFIRELQEDKLLIICNFSSDAQKQLTVMLPKGVTTVSSPQLLWKAGEAMFETQGEFSHDNQSVTIAMPPHGVAIFQL